MRTMKTELQTQLSFRTIMRAMANPGSIHRLDGGMETAALRLVAETLFDQDVTFCVIGDRRTRELEDRLYERTKSPVAELPLADFIVVTGGAGRGQLLAAKTGTPEYPDRGATVIFSVDTLADGSENDFFVRLSGPGIPGQKHLRIQGLDHDELIQLQELNRGYPLGVDSIFVDTKDCITCIPRSVKIQLR